MTSIMPALHSLQDSPGQEWREEERDCAAEVGDIKQRVEFKSHSPKGHHGIGYRALEQLRSDPYGQEDKRNRDSPSADADWERVYLSQQPPELFRVAEVFAGEDEGVGFGEGLVAVEVRGEFVLDVALEFLAQFRLQVVCRAQFVAQRLDAALRVLGQLPRHGPAPSCATPTR